jgi:hypothetical protein
MDRGMNKQGRRTVELLGKLRETRARIVERGPLAEDGDNTLLLARYDELIAKGERYEHDWQDIIHSEANLPPSQALQFKHEWTDWGKTGMQMNSILGLPPDQLRQIILASHEE